MVLHSTASHDHCCASYPHTTLTIGAKYRHYKGNIYRVIAVAHHSETIEPYVVYQALYHSDAFGDNAIWIRPLSMFTQLVPIDGKEQPRFALINT